MEYQKDLIEKFHKIDGLALRNDPKKIRKLYHLNTVENFIIHFEELTNYDQQEVYDTLFKYLDFIENRKDIEVDNTESREMFYLYLNPIATKYYDRIGFTAYARPVVLISIYLVMILILLLFDSFLFFYIIATALILFFQFRISKNKKINKVYGYRY